MKKILFTETNRIATVEKRKINTRRIMNPQPTKCPGKNRADFCIDKSEFCKNDCCIKSKPRYKVGETVYVAEPYRIFSCNGDAQENILDEIVIEYLDGDKIRYYPNLEDPAKWIQKRQKEMSKSKSGFCNKMFMPEWAARTFIKITDEKCEPLQYISDEDCFREGICKFFYEYKEGKNIEIFGLKNCAEIAELTPREAYAAEIDMINGEGTWDSNPYVWSYYYELVKNK